MAAMRIGDTRREKAITGSSCSRHVGGGVWRLVLDTLGRPQRRANASPQASHTPLPLFHIERLPPSPASRPAPRASPHQPMMPLRATTRLRSRSPPIPPSLRGKRFAVCGVDVCAERGPWRPRRPRNERAADGRAGVRCGWPLAGFPRGMWLDGRVDSWSGEEEMGGWMGERMPGGRGIWLDRADGRVDMYEVYICMQRRVCRQ
jgi:hypothetical protein